MKYENLLRLLAGFLGVAIFIVATYRTRQKDAQAAKIHLSLSVYLEKDGTGIILSILGVFVWLLTYREWSDGYPKLTKFNLTSFVLWGISGSWVLLKIFGGSKQWVNENIGAKMNLSDDTPEDGPMDNT